MKLRLLLAVVAGLLLGTPAGRARLGALLGQVRGASPSPSSPLAAAPAPASAAPGASAPAGSHNPLDAPPVSDTSAMPAHAPLGRESTGAEVAIDLFEHGTGSAPDGPTSD